MCLYQNLKKKQVRERTNIQRLEKFILYLNKSEILGDWELVAIVVVESHFRVNTILFPVRNNNGTSIYRKA